MSTEGLPLRRHVLALVAALAAIAAPALTVTASPAAAAQGPAIWLVPHQDDEVLSYGASIKEHRLAGRSNILVLLTDGSESGVCYQLYGDPNKSTAQERADGGLSPEARAKCTADRDAEFQLAAKRLKVDQVVIRADRKQDSCSGTIAQTSDTCTASNTLTESYVLGVIEEMAAQYPGASFKGMSPREGRNCSTCTGGDHGGPGPGHPDHDVIGDALLTAYDQGVTTDVRFYLKPELWGYWPTLEHMTRRGISFVLDAYGPDSPNVDDAGWPWPHGIGWQSVRSFCEQYGGARAHPNTGNPKCDGYTPYNDSGADSAVYVPYGG